MFKRQLSNTAPITIEALLISGSEQLNLTLVVKASGLLLLEVTSETRIAGRDQLTALLSRVALERVIVDDHEGGGISLQLAGNRVWVELAPTEQGLCFRWRTVKLLVEAQAVKQLLPLLSFEDECETGSVKT